MPSCIKLQKDLKTVLADYITWCRFRTEAVKCAVEFIKSDRFHWNE